MKKEKYSFRIVDPPQNSQICHLHCCWKDIISRIPPRSPELNPIENVFNNVKSQIQEQAIERYLRMLTQGPAPDPKSKI